MKFQSFLVTGGAGFIGSNFVRYMLSCRKDASVVNLDKLTYAGNPENVADLKDDARHIFVKGDIADHALLDELFKKHSFDCVVNFAAETHVDRSIGNPRDFIYTDMIGVYELLEASKKYGVKKFIQISTDEVYGSIEKGSFTEESTLRPSNPYSASKAGGDRLAYSYYATYGMPVIVTRASNNFGPFQYPEKFMPLFITNALEEKELPLYGDGLNVRDWLYVEDHCEAVAFVIENGRDGEVYNIGGGNEMPNIETAKLILNALGKPHSLIKPVKDRLGHDRRYSLGCEKLKALGWTPGSSFKQALETTVRWYVENPQWWKKIKSGEFMSYYKKQYGER